MAHSPTHPSLYLLRVSKERQDPEKLQKQHREGLGSPPRRVPSADLSRTPACDRPARDAGTLLLPGLEAPSGFCVFWCVLSDPPPRALTAFPPTTPTHTASAPCSTAARTLECTEGFPWSGFPAGQGAP